MVGEREWAKRLLVLYIVYTSIYIFSFSKETVQSTEIINPEDRVQSISIRRDSSRFIRERALYSIRVKGIWKQSPLQCGREHAIYTVVNNRSCHVTTLRGYKRHWIFRRPISKSQEGVNCLNDRANSSGANRVIRGRRRMRRNIEMLENQESKYIASKPIVRS